MREQEACRARGLGLGSEARNATGKVSPERDPAHGNVGHTDTSSLPFPEGPTARPEQASPPVRAKVPCSSLCLDLNRSPFLFLFTFILL